MGRLQWSWQRGNGYDCPHLGFEPVLDDATAVDGSAIIRSAIWISIDR